LLGQFAPKLFQHNSNWRAFWTQQHGDNVTYELVVVSDGTNSQGENED
jgi:hypothetical protein